MPPHRESSAFLYLLLAFVWVPAAATGLGSDFDIVLNEINYHPRSDIDQDEYLELYNRGPTTVDLSGWVFAEGISLVVPEGVGLGPKEYLLVSPDPDHTRARYEIDAPVIGPYGARLDDGGEVIALYNDEGDEISRVHYGDGDIWPSVTDGLGPTLELISPQAQPDIHRSWAASAVIDGTPGAVNSAFRERVVLEEAVLIGDGEIWAYIKGDAEFPADWQATDFDDGGWESGPTGIGYGDDDDRTVLDDMEGNYLSFAARAPFHLSEEDLLRLGDLFLEIDYDDGYLAYLNGVEVSRSNLGEPGTEVPFDTPADDTHEAGTGDSDLVFVPRSLLNAGDGDAGKNILAVQVHNFSFQSSDASFIPRLASRPGVAPPGAEESKSVVINEIKGTEPGSGGFIELFNAGEEEVSLDGRQIVDSAGHIFAIPAGGALLPGRWAVYPDTQLGFDILLAGVTYALVEPDGRTFIDGLDPRAPENGEAGLSFGRFPDGDDDGFLMRIVTEGNANRLESSTALVINEIHFHPPYVPPGDECEMDCSDADQWVELFNRSGAPVDLAGWSLTKAVDFAFPQGAAIDPEGFVVVASSPERFLGAYPEVPGNIVYGGWLRDLSRSSDTINLRDELGNLVDHVKYGDGTPINDEEPKDGVDDGTFRSSEWPPGAQGSGRTIELIHPDLNNRHGGAWTEGPEGGTPGARNGTFQDSPFPVVGSLRHSPAVPRSGEPVLVTCRVSAAGPVSEVRAIWHADGGGPPEPIVLRDDGLSGDGDPGDGRYGGLIPAQSHGTVVAFQIEATANGRTTVVPIAPDIPPHGNFEGPFFLYQVLDIPPSSNPSADYYVIMTASDRNELESRPVESDVLLPATFISRPAVGETVVRHVAGIRYRGASARFVPRKSYRIDLPPENTFEEMEHVNLNARDTGNEVLASDLFRRAGMPGPRQWTVNLTFNGELDQRYALKERLDGDFLRRYYGDANDDGNLYRAIDPDDGNLPFQGDLTYFGDEPDDYRPYYSKRTNREEDDFTDIIELTRIFDPNETSDAEFADRLAEAVDVWQWARYFAVQSCLANTDGSIHNRTGEDYYLYKVPADTRRPDSGKWVLLPWDLEESFSDSNERLFIQSLPTVQRFIRHERFAPLYYSSLVNLRHGAFSRREARQRFSLIDFLYGFGTIDAIDEFITSRGGFYDLVIPMSLTAGTIGIGTELIAAGDDWRYFKGTEEPSPGTLHWTLGTFDDTSWPEGPSGLGYGDGDDATLLDDMGGSYTTLYIRREFTLGAPGSIGGLRLRIDYDDGFVAYLNGVEVARRGVGQEVIVPFDARAVPHEAGQPEVIDITQYAVELRGGANILAIQGVNSDPDSSDFSLIPRLEASAGDTAGCGEVLYATGGNVGLTGRSNACVTGSVRVDDQPVEYDAVQASWYASVDILPGDNYVTVEARDALGAPMDSLEILIRGMPGRFTPVGGTLSADTVWRGEEGPFVMNSEVRVPLDRTLTIEPGAIILAGEDASIIVDGQIVASGTEAQPIIFRARRCSDRWGGVALNDTGTGPGDPTHLFRHCDFAYGSRPQGFDGCIAPVNSKILIEHCRFDSLAANAVDGIGSRVEMSDSRFSNTFEGVHGRSSSVFISGCTFQDMIGDSDAIDLDGDGSERSVIEGCVFVDGSDDGIDLLSAAVDIRNNLFLDIQDKAVSVERNGTLGAPAITGNIVFRCGTAIALKSGVTVTEGSHNTLVGNQEGLHLFAKAGATDGGHGVFHSTIIWDNMIDVKLDSQSTMDLSFSDVSDDVWPGEQNISLDPMFADISEADFALRPGSPCIGTGKDGLDMGAVPSGGGRPFIRGDADSSGSLNLTDSVYTLDYLFRGGPAPECPDAADVNDDGSLDLSDPVSSLVYLFAGGDEPAPPFPDAGFDLTGDALICP